MIRISNLMMPQNDYLGYMRDDIKRNGEPVADNDELPTISEIIIKDSPPKKRSMSTSFADIALSPI